jgi:hypothetical protein
MRALIDERFGPVELLARERRRRPRPVTSTKVNRRRALVGDDDKFKESQ